MLCVLCVFSSSSSLGQGAQSQRAQQFKAAHGWTDPLTVPLVLSGNFGELRGNHFHTGLDMKTQGREGLPVLASTDGVLARVKMSPWGYGNALYLEGPDGITTVYAHLQRFAPDVQAWAVARTYKGRSLGLDATPPASAGLTFQAGDTLGWSGNSGGSGGPHLHFEVRDTPSQHPLNPLQGWVTKSDSRRPSAPTWWLESERGLASVPANGVDTVVVEDDVRVSLEAYDRLDGASNICGIHTLQAVLKDGQGEVKWTHRFGLDELNFSVNKDMNAHTLFPVWKRNGTKCIGFTAFLATASAFMQVRRMASWPWTAGRWPPWNARCATWLGTRPSEPWCSRVGRLRCCGNGWKLRAPHRKSPRPATRSPCLHPKPPCPGRRRPSLSPPKWAGARIPRGCPPAFGLNLRLGEARWMWWTLPSPEVMWGISGAALPQDAWPTTQWVAVHEVEGQIKHAIPCPSARGRMAHGAAWRRGLAHGARHSGAQGHSLPQRHAAGAGGDAVWFVEDLLSGVDTLTLTIDGRWARLVWDPKRNMATYEASDEKHPSGAPVRVELEVTDAVGNAVTWSGTLVWP